jgi:hypothetical protein
MSILNEKRREAFIKAVKYKQSEMARLRVSKNIINQLWSQLGEITVQCNHCGQRQLARTVKSKQCINCEHSFTICPKNQPSRIVYCPPNKRYLLFQIQSLTLDGKFLAYV